MNNLLAALVLMLLAVVLCVGCAVADFTGTESQPSQTTQAMTDNGDISWSCPPTVMIDGQRYCDWGIKLPTISVEDEAILGYITSVVDISKLPVQDNEANYPNALNAPYARWTDEKYGEVYVIKYGYGWYILLPEDYPIS